MVPQKTPNRSLAHEDDHLWLTGRAPRVPSLVDRERSQQAWPLLYKPRAEDGPLRRFHQRALGTRDDLDTAEALRRQDEPARQDLANRRVQPHRTFTTSTFSTSEE